MVIHTCRVCFAPPRVRGRPQPERRFVQVHVFRRTSDCCDASCPLLPRDVDRDLGYGGMVACQRGASCAGYVWSMRVSQCAPQAPLPPLSRLSTPPSLPVLLLWHTTRREIPKSAPRRIHDTPCGGAPRSLPSLLPSFPPFLPSACSLRCRCPHSPPPADAVLAMWCMVPWRSLGG